MHLKSCADYNVIFLDPPFATTLLLDALHSINNNMNIGIDTLIYIEAPRSFNTETIISGFKVLKHSIYGDVFFALMIKA